MAVNPEGTKGWALTQDALDKLLARLDPDRERAGEKYEKIRRKLMTFFQWRGCGVPEEYADATIDRVAKRIEQGRELHARDPYLYFHGVAINVLREGWRDPAREPEALERLPPSRSPWVDPGKNREREAEQRETERRLECLNECLRSLTPESRLLIARYHQRERRAKIDGRKELAETLQIPLNALRIRVCRIRAGLEACVDSCLRRSPPE